MLLDATANPIMSYILLGVLVLIIIMGPILMKSRNKKEAERMQEMVDSLKKGDKVITTAGVFGKVIGVEEKEGFKLVTIETGNEKNKSYLTLDVGAIYANLSATPVQQTTQKEEPVKVQEQNVEVKENNETQEYIEPEKLIEEAHAETDDKKKSKKSNKKK